MDYILMYNFHLEVIVGYQLRYLSPFELQSIH